MAMLLRCIGAPNRQWELMTQAEIDAMLELQPAGLLLLGYPDSPILADKIAQEAQLWRDLGQPKVLLRPYAENIIGKKTGEWAETCYRLMSQYEQAGITDIEMVPANEFNLEGAGEDHQRQIEWLSAFGSMFKVLAPQTRLHLPALSPIGYYLTIHAEMLTAPELHQYYDVIDAHCYSVADLNDVPIFNGLWQKPVCVTEINQIDAAVYAEYLAQYADVCEGVFWFILSGEGEANKPYWLMGSKYYAAFKTLGKGITKESLLTGPDGLLSASHDAGDEGKMNEYNRAVLWQDYQATIEGTPMFQKVRAEHPELGDALGPERDYGDVRCQFYAGGVVWAKIGDWANTQIARSKEDLPLA